MLLRVFTAMRLPSRSLPVLKALPGLATMRREVGRVAGGPAAGRDDLEAQALLGAEHDRDDVAEGDLDLPGGRRGQADGAAGGGRGVDLEALFGEDSPWRSPPAAAPCR